eukprot:scaffold274705_cov36-Tisochrysis_lutea.AAC.2
MGACDVIKTSFVTDWWGGLLAYPGHLRSATRWVRAQRRRAQARTAAHAKLPRKRQETTRARHAYLQELLGALNLSGQILDQPWSTLSGGESQRVYLCVLLALRPEVLLLDEPTSGCDAAAALAVEKLVASSGVAAIWISHDAAQLARVARDVQLKFHASTIPFA